MRSPTACRRDQPDDLSATPVHTPVCIYAHLRTHGHCLFLTGPGLIRVQWDSDGVTPARKLLTCLHAPGKRRPAAGKAVKLPGPGRLATPVCDHPPRPWMLRRTGRPAVSDAWPRRFRVLRPEYCLWAAAPASPGRTSRRPRLVTARRGSAHARPSPSSRTLVPRAPLTVNSKVAVLCLTRSCAPGIWNHRTTCPATISRIH